MWSRESGQGVDFMAALVGSGSRIGKSVGLILRLTVPLTPSSHIQRAVAQLSIRTKWGLDEKVLYGALAVKSTSEMRKH